MKRRFKGEARVSFARRRGSHSAGLDLDRLERRDRDDRGRASLLIMAMSTALGSVGDMGRGERTGMLNEPEGPVEGGMRGIRRREAAYIIPIDIACFDYPLSHSWCTRTGMTLEAATCSRP